jgi:hypothetical protein
MKSMKIAAFLGLTLSLLANSAIAEPARLIVDQGLHAAPDPSSAVLGQLERGRKVEALRDSAGWVEVRAGETTGWLHLLAVSREMPGFWQAWHAPTLTTPVHDRLVAVTGLRGLPPAKPSAHALILAIGDYSGNIPALRGVGHDVDSARMLANGLGVPEANTRVLRDAELTLSGLRQALDDLERRIQPGDQVFLYYTGHGARYPMDDKGEQCGEGLVSADAQLLTDSEMQERLAALARKARRLVVFIDACHSGGVTTRGLTGRDPTLSVKYWSAAGSERCARPSNILTRGLRAPGADEPGANHLHIAAARPDEASLDEASAGGLATQAWVACLGGQARDSNGSGALSAEELRVCAQRILDRRITDASGFKPHHITLIGNRGMPLAGPLTAPGDEPAAAEATLRDLYANRDDHRVVQLKADRPTYRVKQDRVQLSLTSSHGGHVYLLMVGSDGKTFDLLFPNRKDADNRIRGGETWALPRPGWGIRAGGPAGRDTLLALVTDTPRDFSKLGMRPAGPFSLVEANAATTRDIILVTSTPAASLAPACQGIAAKRTLEVVEECSDAYGAALATLDEID